MDILSIDVGTYSVKFLEMQIERKRVDITFSHEELVNCRTSLTGTTTQIWEEQFQIVKKYMAKRPTSGKIIFNIPENIITTRFLNLPVSNKKKAELMIPFQLDENLPFPIAKSHYVSNTYKNDKTMNSIVNIAPIDGFETYFSLLSENGIIPTVLSSDNYTLDNYFTNFNNHDARFTTVEPSCCVLDFGHTTTKAYFFKNNRLESTHTSNIAGKTIDLLISNTYQINFEEAIEYKHNNCFFLVEGQYDDVDKDQKEFATLMKTAFSPLTSDIKKWILGFQVKHKTKVNKVYITGGTSQINNFDNFLIESLSLEIKRFDALDLKRFKRQKINETIFSNSFITGISLSTKSPPPNFLKGSYSPSSSEILPFHSVAFISSRVLLVSLIIMASLFVERGLLSRDDKLLTKHLNKLIKTPKVGINTKNRKYLRKDPEKLLRIINNKIKKVSDEVNTIVGAVNVNAVAPLARLGQILSTTKENIELVSFESKENEIFARFKSKKIEYLNSLKKSFESSAVKEAKIIINKKSKSLTLNCREI